MRNNVPVDVRLDFRADFRQIVEQILAKKAIAVDPAEPYGQEIYRYYANARRRPDVQSYTVVEASELICPPQLTSGYAEFRSELEQGIDITARLSRTRNVTYEDQLLNDAGILHFHLGLRDALGDVPRTGIVLFALVRGDIVYCIGFFDHESWSKIEAPEILQRNWPQAVEHARVKGEITGYEVTDQGRKNPRDGGANILNIVNGAVFAPMGGGISAAGTSMRAHKLADRAILLG